VDRRACQRKRASHGWIFHYFESRLDNLAWPAVSTEQAIVVEIVLERAGQAMKIVYQEKDDILFIEFSKEAILRDESVRWNANIGDAADSIGEITILDAQQSGICPLPIERVLADAA
jgi:hypothetical protein